MRKTAMNRQFNVGRWWKVVAVAMAGAMAFSGSAGAITTSRQEGTVRTPGIPAASSLPANTIISGTLSSLGGPFITDQSSCSVVSTPSTSARRTR